MNYEIGTSWKYYEGTCGEKLTWEKEPDEYFREGEWFAGTLYVKGQGEMDAFALFCDETFDFVVIEKGCTGIGECAFDSCRLKDVVLPDGLQTIGMSAFDNTGLEVLSIPESVTHIGKDAFRGIDWIIYNGPAESEDNWGALHRASEISGICGKNMKWTLKGTTIIIEGTGVLESVKDYNENGGICDEYCPWEGVARFVRRVIIRDGCTGIERFAFDGNFKLVSVDIPDSVNEISGMAFSGCRRLELVIPENVMKKIHDYDFYGVYDIIYKGKQCNSDSKE